MPGLDIEKEISTMNRHDIGIIHKIVEYVINEPDNFPQLIDIFFSGNYRKAQRVSWIISCVAEARPLIIIPYFNIFIDLIKNSNDNTVRRNILRMYQFVDIGDEWKGALLDECFKIIANRKEATAIRGYALTVADKICKDFPELLSELKVLIIDQMEFEKPSFVSRAKKILSENK